MNFCVGSIKTNFINHSVLIVVYNTSKYKGQPMSNITYYYVDYQKNPVTQQLISLFTYNYLVHPIIFNKTHKVALLHTPIDEFPLKQLNWIRLNEFITQIEELQENSCMIDVWQILQGISFSGHNSCDLIVVAPLDQDCEWQKYHNKFEIIMKQIKKVNITVIDTAIEVNSKVRDFNIAAWGKYGKVITLNEGIQSLTKWGLQVSKYKKPVDVYGYRIDIFEMFDFSVGVYPFTKKNSLTDYITTKTVSTNFEPVTYKYKYETNDKDNDDGVIKNFGLDDSITIVKGYKYGSSIITDLPSEAFEQEVERCFSITGFVEGTVPPWYLRNDSLIVVPGKVADEKDIMIFNELWSSMVRKKVYATVRFVKRKGTNVKHGVLFPKCFVDRETTVIEHGVFIFVETVFKDDEKLIGVPNLMKIEPKYDFDSILDEMDLDKNEKLLAHDVNVIRMNEDLNLFSKLLRDDGRNPFYQTTTSKILNESNPLVSIERLIYLSSYILTEKNRETGGDPRDSLIDIAKREGIPSVVIEKWLDTAKTGVFKPVIS